MYKDGSEFVTGHNSVHRAQIPRLSLSYLLLSLTHFFSCEVFRFVDGVLGDVLTFLKKSI